MPQMAPMMWLNLMFLFISIFCIFFMLVYFTTTPQKIDSYSLSIKSLEKSWKW